MARKKNQDPAGFWSTADHPAVTALALTAYRGNPARTATAADPEWVKKGYAFLLKNVQPDGGIYAKGLLNYNTSLAMMALVTANNPDYEPLLRRARAFTVRQQTDPADAGTPDKPFAGGVGDAGGVARAAERTDRCTNASSVRKASFTVTCFWA